MVKKLLRSYLDIRYTLEGKSPELPDTYAVPVRFNYDKSRMPFGMTPSSQPWPFMEQRGATAKSDGKRQARMMEELHVSCLDIEKALRQLDDDELEIVYKHLIFQTHTLDDLIEERGLTSRGSMQSRVQRIVRRITKLIEQSKEH